MRAYQKTLWVVGLVALGAFSLAGFLADAEFIPRTTVYFALTKMWLELTIRLTAGAVFLFLLVLSIYLPLSTWLKGAGGWITLSNPLGPLSISTEAISKFIQRTGERMEEVRGAKIKVRSAKEGVESYVTLSAHGEAEGGVPRLVNDFQEMVKKYLVEQVGIPDVKKIEVRVTKIF
jgi:hypothetical protein